MPVAAEHPEVLRGEPATPRSDLYGLGVVLEESGAKRAEAPLAELTAQLSAADPAQRPDPPGRRWPNSSVAASGTARALPTRGERTTATTRQLEQPRTARRSAAGPVRTALTHVLTASRTRLGRRRALMLASAALAAVAIIAVLISIAGEGGGGGATTNRQAAPSPPPTDAPLTVQLDTLEHQARSATTR